MACSHKEAIDENAAIEEVQEPAFVVREWYPTPKRSVAPSGFAMPSGQAGMMPSQQPWVAAPPQYPSPAPVTQPQVLAPQPQYVQPAPQPQYGQPVPQYQYTPRPWGPEPQTQPQTKEQAPVQYNPWQTGVVAPPGYGAVPVYPGWGGPGIWAGAPW